MLGGGSFKRLLAVAGILGTLSLGTACAPAPPALCNPGSDASAIFNAANSARASYGLPPLSQSPQLVSLAQQWSNWMAATGQLANGDFPTGYNAAGQNVLTGPANVSASTIVNTWMASPEHRANILSSSFSLRGVALSYANCRVWVTEDFAG